MFTINNILHINKFSSIRHTFVLLRLATNSLKLEAISLAKSPPPMSPIISLLYLWYSTQSAR